jgi:integrase
MKLTDSKIAELVCPQGRKDRLVGDDACPGLAVRVTAGGAKLFLFNHRIGARVIRQRLGVFGADLTLTQARQKAAALRGRVLDGRDPVAERRASVAAAAARQVEAALTVGRLLDDFLRLHLAAKRASYRRDVEARLRLHLKALLPRPAASVTRKEAVREIDRIAREAGTTTARRVLQYAGTMFRWAVKRGAVEGNPFLDLPPPGRVVFRDRALTDDELGAVWRACDALGHPHGALIRILMLTLARREEVTSMTWREVAANLSTWTIPGLRMKRGQPHRVHLPEPAKAILRAIPRGEPDALVFGVPVTVDGRPTLRPVTTFSFIKRTIDHAIARERSAPLPPWVFHDFRRSGASALAGMGLDVIVVDRLLAHQPSNLRGAALVYQRHTFDAERARALNAWAAHVLRCAEGKDAAEGNVIRLPSAL